MPETQTQQGNVASGTAAEGVTTEPKFVEVAKFEALEKSIAKMTAQLNGLSAAQRTATKPKEDVAPTEEQALTLKSLKAEMDTRDQRIREKAIKADIKAFMKNASIDPKMQPFFEAYVERDFKSKLKTDDNDNVVWEDELGELQPFEVLGKKILQGNDTFLTPVTTPGRVGNRNQSGVNKTAAPNKPISQWTKQERAENKSAKFQQLREGLIAQRHPQS